MVNFKLLAVKICNSVKDIGANQIDAVAGAIFDFDCVEFNNENITGVRSNTCYNWVMTLNEQDMPDEDKLALLKQFVEEMVPADHPARDLFKKKIPNEECIKTLQKLEKAIANIKEAIMFLVIEEFSEGETKYIKSYGMIEHIIDKVNNECNLDFVHLNPHDTESSIIAYLSYEKVTEHNIGHFLREWYEPLEASIRENYPINKKVDRIPQPSIKEVKQQVTHMNIHGNVENLALGDINKYDVNIYLNALIKVIQESKDIPLEEKRNLIDKIRSIVENQYVAGISSGLIVEGIKALLTGFKPF